MMFKVAFAAVAGAALYMGVIMVKHALHIDLSQFVPFDIEHYIQFDRFE